MSCRHYVLISLCFFHTSLCFSSDAIDYQKLSHKIFLDTLRAGNHDGSGTNQYYFTAMILALRNTPEDLGEEIEKRKSIARDPVVFGALEIASLTSWQPQGAKTEDLLFTRMEGDSIRLLISEAMRTFNVREDEIAVMVEVKMFEKNKKFWFFGEDTLIGKSKYFPIPSTKFQAPARTNLKLTIIDDKGADVVLKVKYDVPINQVEPVAKDAQPTLAPSAKP